MAVEFKLPDLGEGIHEAEILAVKVKEGDPVKEDQPIFEVETDKAVVEIPSPVEGTIEKIHVAAGQTVKVGTVMVTFGTASGGTASGGAKSAEQSRAETSAQELSRGAEQRAASANAAATTTGAAADREHNGRTTGREAAAVSGRESAVSGRESAVSGRESAGGRQSAAGSLESRLVSGRDTAVVGGRVAAAPATRRLARELGIDINLISGSGPAGRVLNEDVRSYAAGKLEGRLSTSALSETPTRGAGAGGRAGAGGAQGGRAGAGGQTSAVQAEQVSLKDKYGGADSGTAAPLDFGGMGAAPVDLPDFSKYGPVERVPLKSIRRKIAQNMTISWTHIPHVTTFDEANITDFETQRARHEKSVKEQGGRLTLTVFALKAVASGLKRYPQFNASLDEKSGELVFKHYYNIGVAVATERGLIVPVIRDVDKKSIIELSVELADIAEKTRTGKIELDRLQGGTFTITNIGAIGGTNMSPMINYPECAIMGMARAARKPIVKDDKIDIGLILPLALSFDHRIADGAEAAYFLRHVADRLEDPFTLLLEA